MFKKSLCAVVAAFAFSAEPVFSVDEPFVVDALNCGAIACAMVYQGEDIEHPQLIVHIWRAGAGLAATDLTYVYDFPTPQTSTVRMYINNSLGLSLGDGPEKGLTLAQKQTLFEFAPVLAEGVEEAFNSPDTYHLGFWPGSNLIDEFVETDLAQVPQEIVEWDAANDGTSPTTPTTPTTNFDAADELVSPDSCHNCPPDLAQPATDPRDTLSVSTDDRRKARAIKARMQPVIARAARPSAPESLSLGGRATANNPELYCSNENLSNRFNVDTCRDRCDTCDTMRMADHGVEFAQLCATGGVILAGVSLLVSEGTSAIAISFAEAVGLGTSAATLCTGGAVAVTAGHRAALNHSCKLRCAKIFD